MELHFYQDPETGQSHIYNHGVTENEVHHFRDYYIQMSPRLDL